MSTTLCVSLGGSRIEVGVYGDDVGFVGDAPVDWRAMHNTISSGRGTLCAGDLGQVIANRAGSLFRAIRPEDGHLDVGIAFPGPRCQDVGTPTISRTISNTTEYESKRWFMRRWRQDLMYRRPVACKPSLMRRQMQAASCFIQPGRFSTWAGEKARSLLT